MATAILGPPLALGLRLAQLPEPGGVSQHLLVERPEPTRPDEGPVVEARRGERAAEEVGGAHRIEVERGRRVHVLDPHPFAHRLGAGADAGSAVHGDEAVGTLARAAEQAATAVVLERARERALAGGEQGRADRVSLEAGDRAAVERERDLPVAVDALAALLRQASAAGRALDHEPAPMSRPPVAALGASGAQARSPNTSFTCAVQRTSFVNVLRSAMNHSPQPERWSHHSCCTPATFSRK